MFLDRKLEKALSDPRRSDKDKLAIAEMLHTGIERDSKFYLTFAGLDKDAIGKDELVLDTGSGTATFVKEARTNGIAAIALDKKYTMPEGVLMLENERFFEKVKRIMRGEKQNIPPALAGLAEDLPFKGDQFTRIFYIYSAFSYLKSADQAIKVLDEGLRVLKRGGSMHIYPIMHDYESDRYSLLSELLSYEANLQTWEKFFEHVALLESSGKITTEKAYPRVSSVYRDETAEQELYRHYMKIDKL